ncbi:hypothetical protein GOP47_0014150 [Adiantum capillus-veneris]|uniref:Secreted protein n=1 Tax=Adiantum capillus-veneris TaxID=13818 RepID=A0A9D4UPW2_ADICA|nr:hypothetical protein GOP47_0014150 [Adiantum capillus-veneris]
MAIPMYVHVLWNAKVCSLWLLMLTEGATFSSKYSQSKPVLQGFIKKNLCFVQMIQVHKNKLHCNSHLCVFFECIHLSLVVIDDRTSNVQLIKHKICCDDL